jgi:hypothetical protein
MVAAGATFFGEACSGKLKIFFLGEPTVSFCSLIHYPPQCLPAAPAPLPEWPALRCKAGWRSTHGPVVAGRHHQVPPTGASFWRCSPSGAQLMVAVGCWRATDLLTARAMAHAALGHSDFNLFCRCCSTWRPAGHRIGRDLAQACRGDHYSTRGPWCCGFVQGGHRGLRQPEVIGSTIALNLLGCR